MSATVNATPANLDASGLKARLKGTWNTGDYGLFSSYMESMPEEFLARLDVVPGSRMLDVGCGAGQLAVFAAKRGAEVTGCDISPNWLQQARERAALEGVPVKFDEADAEALPYPADHFDLVTSLIAAMFAPRPELVAAELTRVCRPGGKIAMANWTADGFVGRMFKTIARHIAPSGMPSPVQWGDETIVRQRLRERIANIRCTPRMYRFDYPFSASEVVEFFRLNYGPMARAFASLDTAGQAELRQELVDLWSAQNLSSGDRTIVDAEYLEVIAIRQGSCRASLLADRIEQGAAELAAFAETLSDAEWSAPMPGHATDRRAIGIVVHHVASVYPIEIQLAQTIARGQAVQGVNWAVVAAMNAKHASDNARVNKAETIDLLRRHSREAANVVRDFTDDELDRAAPFSLNEGAPLTAQFVIEDHAVRHSWHHLALIRAALAR
ncbi:MAG TPA: methyltransferase domain-containing protein [Bryobacteraceae bacterium]|nr:methyltransferase domain-containing protein [Bryobacteraceae bacterium]